MGVSTNGYLKAGRPDLIKFICNNRDMEILDFNIRTFNFNKEYKEIDYWFMAHTSENVGSIYFNYKKENRRLFFIIKNKRDGKELKQPLAFFSFGCWGKSIELAKLLVDEFGGFADFNDCDNKKFDYSKNMSTKRINQILRWP
jgi:hypothetical protein